MLQLGNGPRLAIKTGDDIWRPKQLRPQDFHGDVTLYTDLPGAVDGAHSALTTDLEQLELSGEHGSNPRILCVDRQWNSVARAEARGVIVPVVASRAEPHAVHIMTHHRPVRLKFPAMIPSKAMSVLSELYERVVAMRELEPVLIFDLDSTLFSTQERNHAILQEFLGEVGAPEDFRVVVEKILPADMGWNVMDDLRRRGFRHEATLDRLQKFWRERFFSDDYVRHDRPLDGAVDFVRAIHDAGALVYYLTGRDEPGMGRGTRRSLEAHGFPLGPDRVILRLKPNFEELDLVFKRRVLDELHHLGPVVAAFENEPANANLFAEHFPAATIVFLETIHSPDPPPLLPHIVRVTDFVR